MEKMSMGAMHALMSIYVDDYGIAERLREAREIRKLTPRRLARKILIDDGSVSEDTITNLTRRIMEIESHKGKPSLDFICFASQALKVSLNWLVFGTQDIWDDNPIGENKSAVPGESGDGTSAESGAPGEDDTSETEFNVLNAIMADYIDSPSHRWRKKRDGIERAHTYVFHAWEGGEEETKEYISKAAKQLMPDVEGEILFPGYIFLTTPDIERYIATINMLQIPHRGVVLRSLDENDPDDLIKAPLQVSVEEMIWIRQLSSEVISKVNIAENGKAVFVEGPMVGMSQFLTNYDRHKKTVKIEVNMFGRDIKIPLAVDDVRDAV